jgi:NADH dehydrogenase [ubiquinone] 1 alpha subcomplex assembly factor 7
MSNTPPGAATPVFERLARRISLQGPITLADFMAEALAAPQGGYYTTRDPFGAAGDFITAPEISQMFGELLGLWCADTWSNRERPARIQLVELGPGRGTLMADALRSAKMAPGFLEAAELHLVEISPALRDKQHAMLEAYGPRWHDDLLSLPEGPALFLANEFFDALPVRQFRKDAGGWREVLVGLSADGAQLTFVLGEALPAGLAPTPAALRDAADGAVAEVCAAGQAIMQELARRVTAHGLAALVIDYGYTRPAGAPSLQALRGHSPHDVLQEPGSADLTAHVDFAALADAAESAGTVVHGPVSQGDFLKALGIELRAETLKRNADARQRRDIDGALHRLTAAEEMGELFKVMAIVPPDAPVPAGFPV